MINTNASTAATTPETFTVQGRVFEVASQNGISHLLVTIYNASDASLSSRSGITTQLKSATRIGSILTDNAGEFIFHYNQTDILAANSKKQRLDLLLVVTAAEGEPNLTAANILYYNNPPRMNAGRFENFNIGISREKQKKISFNEPVNIKESIAAYIRSRDDEKELNQGIVNYHSTDMQQNIKDKGVLRQELFNSIKTRADAILTTGELVQENESIKDKVTRVSDKAVMRANTQVNADRGVQVNLYLTPADRERLQPFFDNAVDGFAVIPEHQLQDMLFRNNSSENPGTLLIHQSPFAKYCAEQTFEEKCAKIHTGMETDDTEHHAGGETPGPITAPGSTSISNADIPGYIAKLVSTAPSPASVLSPEFNDQRADRKTIEDSVDAFSLRKGPAEVPAFYDFSSLQIAFEHVWKVLIDEEIVNVTYMLDKKYKAKAGISLSSSFPHAWPDFLVNASVYESVQQEVPPDIAAQFDITLEEWTDLSASHQKKLKDIAVAIASACTPIKLSGGILGERLIVPANCESKRQDLREQGERLIDAVRHDDYYTLHKTLRDLHDRINSNYEFTVFAADRNFHSVNFGLLNTFRQQWTPINYQAGKLVKTIPLSPKEERKYSMKITRNLKQARKESLKNNSSLKNEQSSTSRVEAEIMEKAQNKTNFSMNTEGRYNIGISKGKATTTFGVEAQQESAENRKDFREAVLKAAQEYSEERNVQVDTEDTVNSEYTESGTVVNPNDELAVTYLFYELQRRYRVSEQLYRAIPVVLVAQEVPAPHQITEAWVISNDWIINRNLLDDSFRPALQYLANKSVGDDFALRELRRNLRQQRNLVESLKTEFAASSREAENKYLALLKKIDDRIDEQAEENGEGFFTNVAAFFGKDDADPETAKARELAASDEHKYAVEKAEKMAVALRQEVNNLHTLTNEYNTTLRNHLDNETRVKRLLVHIRNNIFYYMQAIWSMEPPDQRFLRLHKVQVPQLDLARIPDPANPGATIPHRTYKVEVTAIDDIFQAFREPGTRKHKAFMTGTLKPVTEYKPLVEVADLDSLQGFKGNYMIFPMKQHNALTEFMAAPYVDSAFGAMDPDELSNVNLNDYGKYVCCLHDKLPPAEFEALKPELKKWLELLLADPLRNGDEIVVPTNSLFIEVLPGTHPLLENFKLRHRELDVYKVQAEVRKAELENLRLAARLLNAEREDPDVEKKIVIEGNAGSLVIQPGDQ